MSKKKDIPRYTIRVTNYNTIIVRDNKGNSGTYLYEDLVNKTVIQIIWLFSCDILESKRLFKNSK
jgi:hypothetical protein